MKQRCSKCVRQALGFGEMPTRAEDGEGLPGPPAIALLLCVRSLCEILFEIKGGILLLRSLTFTMAEDF